MKRKITKILLEWKENQARRPLIITGARQAGKTYILRELGEKNYQNTKISFFYIFTNN